VGWRGVVPQGIEGAGRRLRPAGDRPRRDGGMAGRDAERHGTGAEGLRTAARVKAASHHTLHGDIVQDRGHAHAMRLDVDAYHSRATRVDADTAAGDAGKTEEVGIMVLERRDGLREARRLSGGNFKLKSCKQDEKAERNSKREYSAHTNPPRISCVLLSLGTTRRCNFRHANDKHPKV